MTQKFQEVDIPEARRGRWNELVAALIVAAAKGKGIRCQHDGQSSATLCNAIRTNLRNKGYHLRYQRIPGKQAGVLWAIPITAQRGKEHAP